jgi:hypothetical protein
MSRRERDDLVRRVAEPDCPWGAVGGADLADADPAVTGGEFDHAANLCWYFPSPDDLVFNGPKVDLIQDRHSS